MIFDKSFWQFFTGATISDEEFVRVEFYANLVLAEIKQAFTNERRDLQAELDSGKLNQQTLFEVEAEITARALSVGGDISSGGTDASSWKAGDYSVSYQTGTGATQQLETKGIFINSKHKEVLGLNRQRIERINI